MKKTQNISLFFIILMLSAVGAKCQTIYFFHSFASNTNFDYTYGSFTGNVTPGPSFININTNSTSGGAGFGAFSPALDLTATPAATTYIVVRARLRNNHNGSPIRVTLSTTVTDYSEWEIPAALLNTTTFTTIGIPISTPPIYVNGSGVTFSNVTRFNLQGDFTSPGRFHIDVEFMALTPEPEQVVMGALVVLLVGAVALKRYKQKRAAVLASVQVAGM